MIPQTQVRPSATEPKQWDCTVPASLGPSLFTGSQVSSRRLRKVVGIDLAGAYKRLSSVSGQRKRRANALLLLFSKARLPQEIVNSQWRWQMAALTHLSFPDHISKDWKQHTSLCLRQWP